MSEWTLVLLALAGAGWCLVVALGFLFPEVALRSRALAVFYVWAATGFVLQAWEWGKR